MRKRRLFLTLLFLMLGMSLAAVSELARPAGAVSNNSHIVTTTSDRNVYQSSYQNPGFYAGGRYWVFYEDLSGVCEGRSEEHTSELQSVSISYAVFCLKKKNGNEMTAASMRPQFASFRNDLV